MKPVLFKRLVAEFAGTGFLVAAVVGSGIMAERLANGNVAVALLANTFATGAALVALILAFGPISGAHFNPVVSLVVASLGEIPWLEAALYVIFQITGACCGTILANTMFSLPLVSISQHVRAGNAQFLSEVVATFGLLFVIRSCSRSHSNLSPFAVASYICSAYWFTASTSFANPAVTIARALSDTFAGIRPMDVPLFVVAQVVGGFCGAVFLQWLARSEPACVGEVVLSSKDQTVP